MAELCCISEHCQFARSLDDMLRDRLVCGVHDGQLQQRLVAESDLTFQAVPGLGARREECSRATGWPETKPEGSWSKCAGTPLR